jgi:dTDP-4-amino-4,6-dideoxy-D-galactose acyltransferase
MKIVRCDWDSENFGYEVGRVDLTDSPHVQHVAKLFSENQSFRLVYLFSDAPIGLNDLKLVDVRERYGRRLPSSVVSMDSDDIVRYTGGLNDDLLNLALSSGIYSRFKTDENFQNQEFELLYDRWINKSIDRVICEEVFVCLKGGATAGLLTIERSSCSEIRIGLAAVHGDHRGLGIGKKLITKGIEFGCSLGCDSFTVVTQGANLPARNLYTSMGFRVLDRKYVYHFWRN